GVIGVVAILSIMIVLLAVLALVVVNVLAESAWGIFTVGATIPIALLMGGYLRFVRMGKVLEVSVIGVVLLLAAVWGGQFVHSNPSWSAALTIGKMPLAWSLIIYGLAASILPVWLLLAPRDYLSTFMKLGTIFALALGVLLVLPDLRMPAVSTFVDGSGLVIPGKLFPFCFITIACGAISGFHTLIASGVTPKIITRETHARPVGYGAMCLESLVAIMAMIAACTLEPDVYLAMNVGGTPESITQRVYASGFTAFVAQPGENGAYALAPVAVNQARMTSLANEVGESTLYGRAGGAATLAVGMASIFGNLTGGRWLDLWYHFAVMFEALFILTTIDAGTRVGRYLLQDALGHVWKPMGEFRSIPAGIFSSAIVVLLWGTLLVLSVLDPLGGIKSLWPVFGIANQLLAAIALCLITTILLKMGLRQGRKAWFAFVSFVPLLWLMTVCLTAGLQLIFHQEARPGFPKIGFLQKADGLEAGLPALETAVAAAADDTTRSQAEKTLRDQKAQIFNFQLDAVVAGAFITMATAIFLIALIEWWKLLVRRREPDLSEIEPVWLPESAVRSPSPMALASVATIGLALLKEVSGEADIDRAQSAAEQCDCATAQTARGRQNVFLSVTNERYQGVRRCC
ncbi:MAG: carbon starvation CstA family protein, partial [Chthoniobacteraceae bacterium]